MKLDEENNPMINGKFKFVDRDRIHGTMSD